MIDPKEGCPKMDNIVRILAGQAALPFIEWSVSTPTIPPPQDLYQYVEWNFGGNPFMLYKYRSGMRAAWCPGSGSYMLFDLDITNDPWETIRGLMGDDFGQFIDYTFK